MQLLFRRPYIAGEHIHTNITIRNTEEQQQNYQLGMISNRFLGVGEGGVGVEVETCLTASESSPFTCAVVETNC